VNGPDLSSLLATILAQGVAGPLAIETAYAAVVGSLGTLQGDFLLPPQPLKGVWAGVALASAARARPCCGKTAGLRSGRQGGRTLLEAPCALLHGALAESADLTSGATPDFERLTSRTTTANRSLLLLFTPSCRWRWPWGGAHGGRLILRFDPAHRWRRALQTGG